MHIKIKSPILLIGDRCYSAGDTVDLDDDLARRFIDKGAVEACVRIDLAATAAASAAFFAPEETADASPRPTPRRKGV